MRNRGYVKTYPFLSPNIVLTLYTVLTLIFFSASNPCSCRTKFDFLKDLMWRLIRGIINIFTKGTTDIVTILVKLVNLLQHITFKNLIQKNENQLT